MIPIRSKCVMTSVLLIAAVLGGCGDKKPPDPKAVSATPPPAVAVSPAPAPATATPPAAPAAAPAPAPTAAAPAAPAAVAAAAPAAPGATPAPDPASAQAQAQAQAAQAQAQAQAAQAQAQAQAAQAPQVPPPAPVAASAVLATQEFSTDPSLRADVLEMKRVSGGALMVKWRLSRPAAASGSGPAAQDDKGVYHSFSWSNVYLTDPAENKKYSGLKDSQGHWIGQGDNKTYAKGQQQVMWMKFPAPPASSTKVTFVFAGFPPFDDVPVAQ